MAGADKRLWWKFHGKCDMLFSKDGKHLETALFAYRLTSNNFTKSSWKGRNFLRDILAYGVLVVVTFFLLKKLPWSAASIILGLLCGRNPSMDNLLWVKIFLGSALMVGVSVLGGIISKKGFLFLKNGNPSENISISKQESLMSAIWQISESYLCIFAITLLSKGLEYFLWSSTFAYAFGVPIGGSIIMYIVVRFRSRRNYAINDSYYETKRKAIRQQREEAHQQQLKIQEQQREKEAEILRQQQAKIAEYDQKRMAYEEKCARNRATFTRVAIDKYQLGESLRTIFDGQYGAYDLVREAGENESRAFTCGDLCVEIFQKEIDTIKVENNRKISAIEEILLHSRLFEVVPDPDAGGGAAPHLMMLSKTSEPLSLVSKPPVVRSTHTFLEPLYAQVRTFTELRYQELNALISFRIQYYLGQYRIIKAGIDGEEAVERILELHQGSFLVIHNLRLEFPNNSGGVDSVETDTFVMAPYGLFAIETKNYGASGKYGLVVTGDGNWYKEYPSSSPDRPARRERMENPFEQNDRHIAFLERFINDLLGRDMMNYVHVKNIIVVANDNVEINSDPAAKQTLTRVGNLYNQLTQDPTPRFTLDELHRIEQALTERNLPPKRYPMNDYREELRGIVSAYKRLLNLPAEIYAVENKVYPPNRKPVS